MFPEGRILDFLIFGVVALVVVGPKDLPILMRKLGAAMARMRAMAAEFRMSFEEMARQSELDALKAEVEALRASRPLEQLTGADDARAVMTDIEASLASPAVRLDPSQAWKGDPTLEPAAPAPPPESAPAPAAPPAPSQAAGNANTSAPLPGKAPQAEEPGAASSAQPEPELPLAFNEPPRS
ncbi:MAG TPA: Sec-independent protein translocase protein TatB [Caulobacteraceae bacterium]|nr:Sec-independent protein translocase protein TatB [Caulobacteraceae bacterium]